MLMIHMELVEYNLFLKISVICLQKNDEFCFYFQSLDEMNSLILFEAILYGFHVLVILFVTCELGERFSNTLDGVDDLVGQLNWYLLPIEFQRMIPTIMINTQKPVVLKCFGSISCSRDQFKKVNSYSKRTNIFVQWILI